MEWDFTQPYRTETLLTELKGAKLQTPVCILSYKRADAPIFSQRGLLQNTPELGKDNVFVFIRDTTDQYMEYKRIKNFATLVPLPKYVEEAGLTREAILQWCIQNHYKNVFMFDDRLLNLNVLAPGLTCNSKLILGKSKESTNYNALLLWEHFHKLYPTTVSGITSWGTCWYPKNINRPFAVNNPGSCWCYMNIDLEDCVKYDLHFYDTREKGIDDSTFLYFAMVKGLPSRVFTDIAYKEVLPEVLHKKQSGSGSNAVCSGMTRDERLLQMAQTFWKNVLNTDWPDDPPGFYVYKNKTEGARFRFNFAKYWAPYYEQHKVK